MDNELNEHHERETYYEDEIDLYQLIQVLLKRKKLIIGIFLVAVITAIVASYLMKPVYRVSAVVAPGQIYTPEVTENVVVWRDSDVDTPENIEALISQNPFHYQTLAELGWNYQDPKNKFDVKTQLQQRTKYVTLSLDSADPERAKEYLNTLLFQINLFYYPKINSNIKFLQNIKQRIVNEIKSVEAQITLLEKKLDVLEAESSKLETQIEETQTRTAEALGQRSKIFARESNTDDMTPLLLYSNVMQENLIQLDKLLNAMKENNIFQREDLQQDIKDLKVRLANLNVQLSDIGVKLESLGVNIDSANDEVNPSEAQQTNPKLQPVELYGIKIVQEPTIDPQRVSPKRTLMVAVAGVLGLFVGVFAAFAVEFWQSHKVSA